MKKEYISDFELEQYLLGELPVARQQAIARLVQELPSLRTRVQELQKSNETILHEYPAPYMSAQITRRNNMRPQQNKTKNLFFPRYTFPALALASLMVIVVFWITADYHFPSSIPSSTRIKGKAVSLYVYRKKNDAVELLTSNAQAGANDLLRIGYYTRKDTHGIIFSIDGNKVLTLHFPANEHASTRLQTNKKVLLPDSYELDNAPLYEQFFMVTSEEELDAAVIMKKLQLHKDYLPDNLDKILMIDKSLHIISVTISKRDK
jgi:hypothetical protein